MGCAACERAAPPPWRVGWLRVIRVAAVAVGVLLATRFRQGPGGGQRICRRFFTRCSETVDLLGKIPFLKLLVTEATMSAVVQVLWPASILCALWLIYRLFLVEVVLVGSRRLSTCCSIARTSVVLCAVSRSPLHRRCRPCHIACPGRACRSRADEWWMRDPEVALRTNFWRTLYQPSPSGVVP
jgi:hypothetical protein